MLKAMIHNLDIGGLIALLVVGTPVTIYVYVFAMTNIKARATGLPGLDAVASIVALFGSAVALGLMLRVYPIVVRSIRTRLPILEHEADSTAEDRTVTPRDQITKDELNDWATALEASLRQAITRELEGPIRALESAVQAYATATAGLALTGEVPSGSSQPAKYDEPIKDAKDGPPVSETPERAEDAAARGQADPGTGRRYSRIPRGSYPPKP